MVVVGSIGLVRLVLGMATVEEATEEMEIEACVLVAVEEEAYYILLVLEGMARTYHRLGPEAEHMEIVVAAGNEGA